MGLDMPNPLQFSKHMLFTGPGENEVDAQTETVVEDMRRLATVIGGTVGVVLTLLITILVITYIVYRKRQKQREPEPVPPHVPSSYTPEGHVTGGTSEMTIPYSNPPPYESGQFMSSESWIHRNTHSHQVQINQYSFKCVYVRTAMKNEWCSKKTGLMYTLHSSCLCKQQWVI